MVLPAAVYAIMALLLSLPALPGCSRRHTYRGLDRQALSEGAPRFRAQVETIYFADLSPGHAADFSKGGKDIVVIIGLKTEEGDRVSMGGDGPSDDLVAFARSLKRGATYEFPKAWLDFKTNRAKSFGDANARGGTNSAVGRQ
jgi:hypothetical protein